MDDNDKIDNMSLEKSMDALRIDNNNGGPPVLSKEITFSRAPLGRVSSLEDVIEEDQSENLSPIRNRPSRSPRRRLDEDQYSYAATASGCLRSRRRSDPGRISVSPLRARIRIEGNIAEDGDYENRNFSSTGCRVPVRRSSSLDPSEIDEALPVIYGLRSRSRSPHTQVKLRTQRSRSLPGIEFELGEAIGALAVRHGLDCLRPQGATPRRRRSVSAETAAPLEAILEENVSGSKASRRFSTPNVKCPPTL